MSDNLHTKLRLELMVESPALRRAEDILRDSGATGWTVLPAMSGEGRSNRWSRGTDISGASDLVVLVCVGDADIIEPALLKLHQMLDRRIGVLNVSEVRVLRPGRF